MNPINEDENEIVFREFGKLPGTKGSYGTIWIPNTIFIPDVYKENNLPYTNIVVKQFNNDMTLDEAEKKYNELKNYYFDKCN
mgnify:CR=1 FL=1